MQGGNWSSEKFKCILWATHERTKHVYHFKSLYLWLVQTAWNPFWNTFEELLFGEFGIWKIKLEFLFQKAKNVKRAVPVTGTKQKWMLMWIIQVWLPPLAVRVGASSTPVLPTYKYWKSLFSILPSSQLPSAFWEGKCPKEPVTVLLRAKYTLFIALSACLLLTRCANFAQVKHK